MIRLLVSLCIFAFVLSSCALNASPPAPWPSDTSAPAIPETLGVNIHFTNPQPGEVEMLAAAGFRWVRMDFVWQRVETEKGKYDFSAYDRLVGALAKHRIKPLFILDYSNTLYDNGRAPYTDDGRHAFAAWAAASVVRYTGRGFLWEIYNEPNTGFWTPKPKVSDYIKLALETSKAINEVAPGEKIIGPAVWGMDFDFVEECLRSGLLDYWAAVSVHPYRQADPESVVDDYAHLRKLLDKYSPAGKNVPIISSEWGYSSRSFNVDEKGQGELLARQLLINQSQGIALSIWYDWQDDGSEPTEIEHHFGTVSSTYFANRELVYDLKPAYRAAQTLSSFLRSYRFKERKSLSAGDYALSFNNGGGSRFAVWTTTGLEHTVTIPVGPGTYRIISYTGQTIALKPANSSGLPLSLTSAPQYVVFETP